MYICTLCTNTLSVRSKAKLEAPVNVCCSNTKLEPNKEQQNLTRIATTFVRDITPKPMQPILLREI